MSDTLEGEGGAHESQPPDRNALELIVYSGVDMVLRWLGSHWLAIVGLATLVSSIATALLSSGQIEIGVVLIVIALVSLIATQVSSEKAKAVCVVSLTVYLGLVGMSELGVGVDHLLKEARFNSSMTASSSTTVPSGTTTSTSIPQCPGMDLIIGASGASADVIGRITFAFGEWGRNQLQCPESPAAIEQGHWVLRLSDATGMAVAIIVSAAAADGETVSGPMVSPVLQELASGRLVRVFHRLVWDNHEIQLYQDSDGVKIILAKTSGASVELPDELLSDSILRDVSCLRMLPTVGPPSARGSTLIRFTSATSGTTDITYTEGPAGTTGGRFSTPCLHGRETIESVLAALAREQPGVTSAPLVGHI